MAAWKAAGITVIPVVAAAILAKHLEPLGIDAVIAEGTESGGHVGEMTTMALVPQVVDASMCRSSLRAALPMDEGWLRRWHWGRAVCRSVPVCWRAPSAPSMKTIKPPC